MFAFIANVWYNICEQSYRAGIQPPGMRCSITRERSRTAAGGTLISMPELTEKQKQILNCITEKIERDGFPPSVRELCAATGLKSPSSVHSHLKKLEMLGYLSKETNKTRAIRVRQSSPDTQTVRVPILGVVTAGQPILAVENVEGYISVDNMRASKKELFALRVRGESMINAGILDGDIVVVERTPIARNGEIVVALLGDEATVKRFFRENGKFRLQPENPDMQPIYAAEVTILGRVIICYRYY